MFYARLHFKELLFSMDASARSSIESTLASDDGLLSEKEGTESYIEGGATRTRVSTIILLVPWILCVALLATIVVQARIIRVGCILSEPRWGRRELGQLRCANWWTKTEIDTGN